MKKFYEWCLKFASKKLVKLDSNKDGIVSIEIRYDIEDKKIDYKIY